LKLSKWDWRALLLAKVWSTFSKDPSTCVGACIVNERHRFLGHGYNGFAPGVDDTRIDDREWKYKSVIHAEINAILDAGGIGITKNEHLAECTVYVWGLCMCAHCTGVALTCGCRRFVCAQPIVRPDWEASFAATRDQIADTGAELICLGQDEIDPRLLALEVPRFLDVEDLPPMSEDPEQEVAFRSSPHA
jgi:dCMP deaminase